MKLKIKFIFLMTALTEIALIHTNSASAKSQDLVIQLSEIQLSEILISHLTQAQTYESYMFHIMQFFPQNTDKLTKEYISITQHKENVSLIASQVSQILQMDMNSDGIVTHDEFKQECLKASSCAINHQNFIKLDLNADTKIDYQEMRTVPEANTLYSRHSARLEELLALDPNKNGVLTAEELRTVAEKTFTLVDTDKNKKLSTDEQMVFEGLRQKYQRLRSAVIPEFTVNPEDELHVVGVYEPSSRTSNGAQISINITRPQKSVTLLLTSHEAVKWNIKTENNTTISKVFLSSYDKRSKVLVNGSDFTDVTPINIPYAYQIEGINFRKLLYSVKASTKRDRIDSFHGQYAAPAEGFVINEVSQNPELKYDRLTIASPEKLPSLTIYGVLNGQYGEYTLTGELIKKLPSQLQNAAYVAEKKRYYKLDNEGISVFDMDGMQEKHIPISLDVPNLSWPTAITYNPKERALVFASLGGEGFLYNYHLASQKWSAVSLNNVDTQSLFYDEITGGYLAVENYHPALLEFDNKGKLKNRMPIDLKKFQGIHDIYDVGNSPLELSVIPFPSYYVYVAGAMQRVYLQDRKTGEVQLTFAVE